MNATLWVLLVVAGFGGLWCVDKAKGGLLKALLVRAAAFSFAGAGMIGASGWIGTAITKVIAAVNEAAAEAGMVALGTAAVWIAWLVLGLAWILTILPESWFGAEMPDWLSVTGLVLPALAVSIPGPIGNAIQGIIHGAGQLMISLIGGAVGQ